jgi:predicted transcriptional regulator
MTENFNQKAFLKEVRAFMRENHLTVRGFAKLSKVAFATLYRLEKKQNEITFITLRKLQKAIAKFKSSVS